jgi:CDP-diglyceride synthetase
MAMLWSRSPWIVLPMGAVVAGLMLWLIVFMQRSPNVSRRGKRVAWLYLFLVLMCAFKIWIRSTQCRTAEQH